MNKKGNEMVWIILILITLTMIFLIMSGSLTDILDRLRESIRL